MSNTSKKYNHTMDSSETTSYENYMRFTKTTNDKCVISNFVEELRQSDNWDNSNFSENPKNEIEQLRRISKILANSFYLIFLQEVFSFLRKD